MATAYSGAGTISAAIGMFETIGFVDAGSNRLRWGDDEDASVFLKPNPEANTFKVITSDGDSEYMMWGQGYSGYPIKVEYYNLKNGGIVFKSYFQQAEAASIQKTFEFAAIKQSDGTYKYLIRMQYTPVSSSSYYIYEDDNNGNINRIKPLGGTLTDSSANVCQIVDVYDQHSGFMTEDVKALILNPSSLDKKYTYNFEVGSESYVMGMSEAADGTGIGNRLCFRMAE